MPYEDDQENPADDFLNKAWGASTPSKRANLARKALKIDPNLIDAYVVLAMSVNTLAEEISLLRESVRIGDKVWIEERKRPKQSYFWRDGETRPYMRAIHNLALALWKRGEREEAARLADYLIYLN